MILHISNAAEFDEVVAKGGLVLADFFTTWCGPCKMLSPIIEKVADENPSLTVIKVDAEEASELSARYRINAVPTLIKFNEGKLVEVKAGYMPEAVLLRFLGL